jgi:hypothetical protein
MSINSSPVIIINNDKLELQELNRTEEDYITSTNKRKKDKKKAIVQKQEPIRVAPYKKKTRNEEQSTQI